MKAPWIVIASCLALTLLILFQVNWLGHSRRLLEEQFDQKVTMALCSAVEQLEVNGSTVTANCAPGCESRQLNCAAEFISPAGVDEDEMRRSLESSLERYGIEMDFQLSIAPAGSIAQTSSSYCGSLQSITQDSAAVKVVFDGKKQYIIRKLGLMAGASIFLLLFIGSVFVLTLVKLFRQKQLHELSVDFFNHVAHEFRTPLTNINLALSMQKRQLPEAGNDKYLKIIQEENGRLLEQVERLLHVARMGENEYDLEKEKIELTAFLGEVARSMHMQAEEKCGNIRLQSGPEEPLPIMADRLHLSNAIRNIIDNALKYCEQAPNVLIRVGRHFDQAHIAFQDNGVGMDKTQRRQVFEKFRRGPNGDFRCQNGFGLGLAYVKKVIELHKGTITIESEPQKGTVFNLFLPLNADNR
jgi:two-component system, OmpR family, phosphate regulon sensor histidine kinase PhoR